MGEDTGLETVKEKGFHWQIVVTVKYFSLSGSTT